MTDSFDRALRAAARRGRPVEVCPDAAMLAAYVDRALTPDERLAIEAHAADCTACQQHLALLGAVSVEPAERAGRRSWLVRWGWLVPVATAVLVVAVWTRLPDRSETPLSVQSSRSASTARPGADVVLSAPEEVAKVASDLQAAAKQKAAAGSQEKAAASQPAAEREASNYAASRVDELREEAKTDAAPPLETRQRRVQPQAAAPAAPPAPPAKAAPAPAVPGREQQADRAQAETAATLSRDAAAVAVESPPVAVALKKEIAAPPVVFASATERYRALGHRIEQSGDGASWREVFAAPSLTFTAAACGPDGACWFGTTTGRLQRRTGGSFFAAQLPERRAIVAIAPEAGGIAVVTIDDGRRFRTADHGATWQPAP